MTIAFEQIPADTLTPFTFVEFSNTNATRNLSGSQPYKILVFGQKLGSGSAPFNRIIRVSSSEEAAKLFGWGSMLHHQFRYLKANNPATETFAIALADPSTPADGESPGVELGRAEGSFSISGPATAAGVLSAYVGDRAYEVPVQKGDSSTTIASRLTDLINDDDLSYVSASVGENTVVVAAKHRGQVGNEISLQLNYRATENFPDGLEETSITQMSGGSSNPDLSEVLDDIDETQYNVLALPYHDMDNLNKVADFLESRWGPETPYDGHAFTAINASLSELTSMSINSKQISILDAEGLPTPSFLYSSALAGLNARFASVDPARPQQTLQVVGVKASKKPRKRQNRDTLLKAGISTHTTNGENIFVERLVTTYTKNPLGAKDVSYRDVATKQTLSFIRWDFINYFNTKYSRFKLAQDGTYIAPDQPILTPKTAKAEAIARFKKWQNAGLVEGLDQFKAELVVEISPSDPNRLSFLLPPDIINQLRVIGAQIAFLI